MKLLQIQNRVRDQLAFFNNPARIRRPAFMVIDRLQRSMASEGEQLLGTAVALVAMCQAANVPLDDVMRKALNVLSDAEGPYSTHVGAIRDYAAGELAKAGRY